MMNKAIALFTVLASFAAQADGFRCSTVEGDLDIKIYNKVQPSEGVRNAAVLVLSNPAIAAGRKTIATFGDTKGTLSNEAATYSADVDLRMLESNRKGELIAGTKLGHLDTIVVDVAFSYASPMADGESTTGELTLVKRDGDVIKRDLECSRYLKN
jgi:hypothetical protein